MRTGPHLGFFFRQRQEPGRAGLPTMSVTLNDSLVLRDDLERRTKSTLRPDQHLLVRQGDIAYNMMRMWQGACGLATADGIVSPAYIVLAPKEGIDSRFAYHWFKTDRLTHLFWAYSHGLTEDRLRLYFYEFAQIPASPPPLEQQRRIVAVLDAWDRALDLTERLIAAKRRRKTGVLASIFGKETNPFKTKGQPLGDFASIKYGRGLAPDDYVVDGQSRVYGTQGEIGRTSKRLFDGPAIIVGRKGTLDNPSLVNSSRPFWAIDTTFVVQSDVSAQLLHAFLGYIDLRRLNEASGVPSLSSENLAALQVPAGSFSTPKKLEAILTIVDADISNSTEFCDAIRAQKRGLMQKFLTGERRLDEDFDEAAYAPHALAAARAL